MSINRLTSEEAREISRDEGKRERRSPRRGDRLYLTLSDQLLALRGLEDRGHDVIVDYGAGSSPYRDLFPAKRYIRADLEGMPELDVILEPGKPLAVNSASVDMVLSTQVLEHVVDPEAYLRDCLRMLKPGGELILSTHGTFPDHCIPWDYYRWTAYGLGGLLEKAGFELTCSLKLTAGPRAVLQLLELYADRIPASGFFGIVFRALRNLLSWFRPTFHRWLDKTTGDCRCVESDEPVRENRFYLGLLMVARRP
jgi:SAM-dependent methyltransferase